MNLSSDKTSYRADITNFSIRAAKAELDVTLSGKYADLCDWHGRVGVLAIALICTSHPRSAPELELKKVTLLQNLSLPSANDRLVDPAFDHH
jgi:hypothetical protein